VGVDGPNGVGRSSGCEDDQSCGPNRGQVVYRLMPRPVVSVLGELESQLPKHFLYYDDIYRRMTDLICCVDRLRELTTGLRRWFSSFVFMASSSPADEGLHLNIITYLINAQTQQIQQGKITVLLAK